MNNFGIRPIIRISAVALFFAWSSSVQGQGVIDGTCQDGKFTVKSVKAAPGQTSGGYGGGSLPALERSAAAYCAPASPEFITEDSKLLLSKIKLAKAQSDSSKKLTNAFAARQNSLGAQRMKAINEERQRSGGDSKQMSKDEARRLYLTPEMQGLRTQFALSIRVLLAPEQAAQFETNLAALKAKDEKISG